MGLGPDLIEGPRMQQPVLPNLAHIECGKFATYDSSRTDYPFAGARYGRAHPSCRHDSSDPLGAGIATNGTSIPIGMDGWIYA